MGKEITKERSGDVVAAFLRNIFGIIVFDERENGNQYRDGAYIDSGFTDAMCVEEIDQKDQKNVVSRQDG